MSCIDVGTAIERDVKIVEIKFFDADDAKTPVTPNDVRWSLYAADGVTIVNGRLDVAEVPAQTTNIVMSGADLALDANGAKRYVLVEGTFNSITYGSNLPFSREYSFIIKNSRTVT